MTRTIGLSSLLVLVAVTCSAQTRPSIPKPNYPKLGSRLAAVVEIADTGATDASALRALENRLSADRLVPVTIRTTDSAVEIEWLANRGSQIANAQDDVIEAFVSVDGLRDLSARSTVVTVREIERPQPRLIGQGATIHNALNWQSHGFGGAGVRVGIIDSFVGFSGLMGTELPASVTARCYSTIGVYSSNLNFCQTDSNHGTAVAEALIDVAPQVQLFIANPISPLDLRQTVDWMTSQGVRVINHSIGWGWDGPGDGTSPYSDSPLASVNAAVAGGAVFVTAAGNEGQSTWFGSFTDINANNWAEFDNSGLDDNFALLYAGEQVQVQLRWQDSWTAASRDIDLYLYNSAGALVAAGEDYQTGVPGDAPREVLIYTVPVTGVYDLAVRRFSGSVPAWIQLQFFTSQPLGVYTAAGSITNPAESANPGVLAVGAAAWSTPATLEVFSSQGPTPDGRVKPDIVGVDRADSVTRGANAFSGTSQASPHVAGLAALVRQAFPTFTPAQVAEYLKYFALPRGAAPNNTWGYGLAYVPSVLLPSGPTVALDRNGLRFGAVTNGSAFVTKTSSQSLQLTQSGSGTATWTATSNQPWLQVTPASGTGPATVSVSVVSAVGLPTTGTVNGSITFVLTGAANALNPVSVGLTLAPNGNSANPFGTVDTPTDNQTGVSGAVPFTGWALDDIEVTRVSVCRAAVGVEVAPVDPNCGGWAQMFVGFAVFIDGARPDVAAAFPNYPVNTKAGWGFMVLTNMLPSQGNGTFVFTMWAQDREGRSTVLGTRTMTCANATATKPFGAIDTPTQGGPTSGNAYAVFGWVLSRLARADPPGGGTVTVLVDGVAAGSPGGWTARPDLAALFAGYPGINTALAVYGLNTTALANGMHTIVWVVVDNLGVAEGIGSRFFTVSNGASAITAAPVIAPAAALSARREAPTRIFGRRGWTLDAPLETFEPDTHGRVIVRSEEVNRVELHFEPGVEGFLRTSDGASALPIGSHLDRNSGVFTWAPGVGFVGNYDFSFVRDGAPTDVQIVLQPKSRHSAGPQVVIDTPRSQQDVGQPFLLGGWAADLNAASGTGIATLHAWAYPLTGGPPVFLGAMSYGGARRDVAAVYGEQFEDSGFGLHVQGLAPGNYDLAVFAWSTERMDFVPARTVRVTVRP